MYQSVDRRRPPPSVHKYEINILCELCLTLGKNDKMIRLLKKHTRRIQNREHETWWDDFCDDDREFDEGSGERISEFNRHALAGQELSGGGSLPIELRVKLGIARAMKEQFNEANVGIFTWNSLY